MLVFSGWSSKLHITRDGSGFGLEVNTLCGQVVIRQSELIDETTPSWALPTVVCKRCQKLGR